MVATVLRNGDVWVVTFIATEVSPSVVVVVVVVPCRVGVLELEPEASIIVVPESMDDI